VVLAGDVGALCDDIVDGAVVVSRSTEPHMAAKATDPTASRAASATKYSWKIHTLSAMLTTGCG
jgi:coenzyme F420-reducing hydrogenase beta subunit